MQDARKTTELKGDEGGRQAGCLGSRNVRNVGILMCGGGVTKCAWIYRIPQDWRIELGDVAYDEDENEDENENRKCRTAELTELREKREKRKTFRQRQHFDGSESYRSR